LERSVVIINSVVDYRYLFFQGGSHILTLLDIRDVKRAFPLLTSKCIIVNKVFVGVGMERGRLFCVALHACVLCILRLNVKSLSQQ